jgi:uncharacterized protein with HEPN domain
LNSDRLLRLAGEAAIGRLGDIAAKLPDEIVKATPEIPWRDAGRGFEPHQHHVVQPE